MAKNRPTQRLQKGIREAVIFSQRKGKAQRFMFDTVISREDSEDTRRMLEDIANERRLGVKIKPNYCQIGVQNNTPPFGEWAQDAITRIEPGERYFVLVKTDNIGNTVEKALFKNDNGVPVQVPLEKRADHEWEQLVKSIPRGQTGVVEVDETQNYETAPVVTNQGFPSVSQSSLEPIRDTEIPATRRDKIPNVERQVDTEIPTKRKAPESPPPIAPQSHSDFSPEDIASAEFGIPPEHELEPSNTSQLFRDDVPMKKSSDSTLMPVDDTQYSDDKTEKDSPVLSPSQTTIQFKNDTPIPSKSSFSDDDLQLSDEDFDLSDDDSEAIVDLEGELGDTRFLERTPTGKLVKPDGEKLIDASAPSLKPISSHDTEMVPALKPREPSMQEEINAHFASLENKENDYFGRREDSDDEEARLRGLTSKIDLTPDDTLQKILGKKDIVKNPISMEDDFLDGSLSSQRSKDVGEDTELNMPRVEEEFVPGSKTERLPPIPSSASAPEEDGVEDMYVLDSPVAPEVSVEKKPEKVMSSEKSHAKAMRIIGKLKDAGWDFDEHGRAALKTSMSKGTNGLVLSKELLNVLVKGNVSQNDLILVPRMKMQGDDAGLYERILKIEGNPDEDLRKNMLKIYDEQVKHNSELSDSEKRVFYESFVGREPKPKVSWGKRVAIAAGIAAVAFIGGYSINGNQTPANNSDLEGKLAQVTTERDSANSKYDKLSKEYQILINSEKDLKSQLENAKKEKSALEESMKSAVSKEEFDSLSKQYESLKLEEQKIKEQLENLNKEKSSLESLLESEKKNSKELLESQKSEYESQLSDKDNLINELNEKYSSYVPKETLDEWVQKFSNSESRFNDLRKEMDSLKAELDKYKKLGSYDDLKGIVDMPAVDSEKLRKAYLSQLESFSVTDKARGVDDELNRNILSIRLTKYTLANEYEAQVWLRFMDIMKQSDDGSFGSREQAPFVASTLVGAMKNLARNGSKYDESALDAVISKYKSFKGSRSDDKTCLSAAELTEEHFRINK